MTPIDTNLVRRLVSAQFPAWSALSVEAVAIGGWDNRVFRLGDRMLVRLPSAPWYVAQVDKEHRWLPQLATSLPLPIPQPLARGMPGEGYPWPWSVYRWIDGDTAATGRISDRRTFAIALGEFLRALQRVDATNGPPSGSHNFHRGGPLSLYDAEARQATAALSGRVDTGMAKEVWERALASLWRGAPLWLHGDVAAGNLLVRDGRLSAVIDFGTCGVGDPACDLTITWTFFSGDSRTAFWDGFPDDGAMWDRARGWAMWKAMITLLKHLGTNEVVEQHARQVIVDVIADHAVYHA